MLQKLEKIESLDYLNQMKESIILGNFFYNLVFFINLMEDLDLQH